MEQAITITDTEIVIYGQFFIHKDYSVTKKDVLLDVLGKNYKGQQIRIKLLDGENHQFSGFDSFIQYVCDAVGIPYSSIVFETHNPDAGLFNRETLRLGIFISVDRHLPQEFDKDLSTAKFVGSTLGRYNISRLRLAYELDTAFPDDTFITFQSKPGFIADQFRHFGDTYQNELAWFNSKTFDKDLTSQHYMGMIDWQTACANYGKIWNQYQIEVISETDSIDNFWFTEKTANCLATGKPFVLLSGQGSLQRLRDMGFITFENILDESYDKEAHPYNRIKHIVQSLTTLYTSPNRKELVDQMYALAQSNIELYKHFINVAP